MRFALQNPDKGSKETENECNGKRNDRRKDKSCNRHIFDAEVAGGVGDDVDRGSSDEDDCKVRTKACSER